MATLAERLRFQDHTDLEQLIVEAAKRAGQKAIEEHWLHGSPVTVLRDGAVVQVWPDDESIEKFPCYRLVVEQYQRKSVRT